jgi:hypothetical protein
LQRRELTNAGTASNVTVPPGRFVYFDTTSYDEGRRDGSTIIGHADNDGTVHGRILVLTFLFISDSQIYNHLPIEVRTDS